MEELKIYATLPKYGPIPFLKRKEAIKKGFKYYFNGKLCKQNHYCPRLTSNYHCSECLRLASNQKNVNDYQANIEEGRKISLQKSHRYRERNPEAYKKRNLERSGVWAKANPKRHAQNTQKGMKKWAEKNPELFALRTRNHARITALIKQGRLLKGESVSRSIGCNGRQLKVHIESQFVDGMSWENFDQIAIDHIRPISSFSDLLNNKEQRMICINYRNLQPLWIKDNRAKSDDYTPLDELAWVERMQALGYEGELFLKYEEGNSY